MTAKLPPEREAGIQAAAVEALRWLGYSVLETSAHQARGKAGALGTDKGIPDLLVAHRKWATPFPSLRMETVIYTSVPLPVWIGIETKNATGRPSKEQQELLDIGRIVIARSAKEAVAKVREIELRIFGCIYGGKGDVG